MGFELTFCHEKPLNAASNVEKVFQKSVCAFYFSNSKLLDVLLQQSHLDICFLCWTDRNCKWQQIEFLQWI